MKNTSLIDERIEFLEQAMEHKLTEAERSLEQFSRENIWNAIENTPEILKTPEIFKKIVHIR